MSLSNLFHFLTLFPFFVSFLLRCFLAASIASSSEEVVGLGVISLFFFEPKKYAPDQVDLGEILGLGKIFGFG